MPKYKIKDLRPNDTVQFQSWREWNTIARLENGTLMVSCQGDGAYERYEIDEKGADRLIKTATSELI